jgi:hypothetical protein
VPPAALARSSKVNGQESLAQTREGTVNAALAEALMTERARDRQTRACWSRLAQQARRARHRTTPDKSLTAEGQPDCLQAVRLRSA